MIVYLARDIPQFVMYCVNGKPRSSLFIESTDSMIHMHRISGRIALSYLFKVCDVQTLCWLKSEVALVMKTFTVLAVSVH